MSPNFFKTPKNFLREIEPSFQDDQAIPKTNKVAMCLESKTLPVRAFRRHMPQSFA